MPRRVTRIVRNWDVHTAPRNEDEEPDSPFEIFASVLSIGILVCSTLMYGWMGLLVGWAVAAAVAAVVSCILRKW